MSSAGEIISLGTFVVVRDKGGIWGLERYPKMTVEMTKDDRGLRAVVTFGWSTVTRASSIRSLEQSVHFTERLREIEIEV